MSSTIDAKGYLNGWLQGVTGMYMADIAAIPDDRWTAKFGGCTRPASELTADAASLLFWAANAMAGNVEAASESDLMEALMERCATKEGASSCMKEASEQFGAALAGASDETLSKVVTPPWQMDAPLFMIAQIAVSHIWYHDGQLNYIQSLLGDEKVHWH